MYRTSFIICYSYQQTYNQYDNSIYRMSQEEWTKLRESVPYVELYLYPKLNGYGDNGQRSLKL